MTRYSDFSRSCLLSLVVTWALAGSSAGQDAKVYAKSIRPFLEKHCFSCHGEDSPKAGLRLDILAADFVAADFVAADKAGLWTKVLERMEAREMPPKKRPAPPQADQDQVVGWIHDNLLAADRAAQAASPFTLRRLNRLQYERTIHDLLAIDVPLQGRLPEDKPAFGFDNVGEALSLSAAHLEAYLETADKALDAAIVHHPRPVDVKRRYTGFKAIGIDVHGRFSSTAVLDLEDTAVLLGTGSFGRGLLGRGVAATGWYRVRASVYGYQTQGESVRLTLSSTVFSPGSTEIRVLADLEAPPETPKVFDVLCRLEKGEGWVEFKVHGGQGYRGNRNPRDYSGPGLAVQWIELEGPLLDSWPPPSHQRLFGNLPLRPVAEIKRSSPKAATPGPLTVDAEQPAEDAERLLRAFMRRAYRRPVTPKEAQPLVDLVARNLKAQYGFEEAMRVGYKAVLCSPDFLFFQEKKGVADDFALAARLSYFLWNTLPDDELSNLAERGLLSRPETLRAQVERLLNHPQAQGFIQNFVAQWLDLRLIDFTVPDSKLYPEYGGSDVFLKQSIVKETELFFAELLKRDLSLTNFVDSDFAILNERLAQHYGIAGVKGVELRPVQLPPGSQRGGVLTQASVLKVTANGTTTSPVNRGVWVLRNILGKPPDPPPPDAGAIEPDIRGATTIRQQFDLHRRSASCAACHLKIDPLGFALEKYDVMGGWRENYRVLSGPMLTMTKNGPPVETDSKMELPNGQAIENIDDLKKFLLEDKDQLARCLTEKLLIYATGKGLRFSGRAESKEIVGRLRTKNYGLRSLVHEVVQSRTFMNQ